ncbi:hypothetical protein P872_07145 [Rhodonellum psychrophilum GCM71 = DSM 17998]|uniref:Uncharacterized protein n=1 Tax=Rhodonellum psychrophilum GCM71 = DSM 17998 TaxID=1123057 RepID=U5BNQ1_9BACT|nr:hypothetical protein P872_07145 [Rhodonellum psychrophilum GCM71 = DSM 17998]
MEYGIGFQMGLKPKENQAIRRIRQRINLVKSKTGTNTEYHSISGWNTIGNALHGLIQFSPSLLFFKSIIKS